MTLTTKPKLTFEQFLEQYPEDGRYELVDGEIVRVLATRQHEDIADLIADAMKDEVKRRLSVGAIGRVSGYSL